MCVHTHPHTNILTVTLPHTRCPWGEITHAGGSRVRYSRPCLVCDFGERLLALIKMWAFSLVLTLLLSVWFFLLFFLPGGADIDQLITISGMVIRSSQLIPEMQEAFFQCQVCAFSTRVEVDRGRIAEPAVCRHCNNTHSLALIHNRSVFSDKQMVRGCGGLGSFHNGADCHAANDA